MKEKYFAIVNPNAGKGDVLKKWNELKDLLHQAEIDFDFEFTKGQYDASFLCANAIKSDYRQLLSIGGDGTLHEVLNGVFMQELVPTAEINLGKIPFGTGNDWGKTYRNPLDMKEAVELIKNGNRIYQDVGKIIFHTQSGLDEKYFCNIAGFGFDGLVLKDVLEKKERGKSGKLTYLMSLFFSLLKSGYEDVELKVDDIVFNGLTFSIAAGIGRYNGNGMMQLPFALPDDGILDITWIKDISKAGVIANVKGLFDGSFITHPKVHSLKGKEISIKSAQPMMIEADGEFLGTTPAQLSIIPKAVQFIVNDISLINKKDHYVS